MAKKSMIEKNNKRKALFYKYRQKREDLKQKIHETQSIEEKYELYKQLQLLPRNSNATRIYNRCFLTGRSRAVYRDFGLSRQVIREMVYEGLLPGVRKSSW